jgi:gliding motility associated protien GldN
MTILNKFRFTATAALLLGAGALFAQPAGTADPSVSGTGNSGVNKDWLPSRTPDGAYDRVPHNSTPVAWQHLREDDILWKKRVWREIDTREKQNVAFRYQGDENTGGGMFIEILLDAIKRGKIKAYNSFADDRFTTIMTKEEVMESIAGKVDTITQQDPVDGHEVVSYIKKDFKPESITQYRIKEDWIFDRNEGKMIVRIVGLAPVKDVYGDGGEYRGKQAMFWLYYPDIRGLLAQYEVVNPLNDVARYTWDEFFESRQFSSKITKVSNPFQADFKSTGNGMSPMETLYENQHSAEEIFNKEHDMWVY